jgi:hypothetical protein
MTKKPAVPRLRGPLSSLAAFRWLRPQTHRLRAAVLVAVALVSLTPIRAWAQSAAQDALAMFPSDTEQFAYSDLSQMRTIPQFPVILSSLVGPGLRSLESFLKPAGIDPEKDVQQMVLGWRSGTDTSRFFGIAEGNFNTDQVQQYFINQRVPFQTYQGYDLYPSGSGSPRTELFVTFLNSSTAAFGRLEDLKALIDVQNNTRSSLETNTDFQNWADELEGTAPQWGIATGPAAANQAIPWLTAGKNVPGNLSALFSPVRAVLYRVNWSQGSGVRLHLSVHCQNLQAAAGLSQLFTLLHNSASSPSASTAQLTPAMAQVLQNLEVNTDGSNLSLDTTAPIGALGQLLNSAAPAK